MEFDKSSISPILDLIADQAQKALVSEDKRLINAGIDAGQNVVKLGLDNVENDLQAKELAILVLQAVASYDGSVPETEEDGDVQPDVEA